ncbi:hypothetical protein NP233_g12084 [Leucocoprinus birnbaumii]|uniref:Uncharacterized protein n=1 Tax=Leucocoprinus birnbaumii TaxID=56174 RepID=A0AAD5VFB3_9AGAR|nr:hypothetical protein NP233_g12084 [Leucocoprinus birnbaumii]
MTGSWQSAEQRTCSHRAAEVVESEWLHNSTHGYHTSNERMLIPWPEIGLNSSQDAFSYETDVVTYDYDCHWPHFTIHGLESVDLGNGDIWKPLWYSSIAQNYPSGATISLYPDQLDESTSSPRSAVLFIPAYGAPHDINHAAAVPFLSFQEEASACRPRISLQTDLRVLLCKTHVKIRRAKVTLHRNILQAELRPASFPLINNFPEAAANAIFSFSTVFALNLQAELGHRMSHTAFLVFAGPAHGAPMGSNGFCDGIPSISMSQINENMGRLAQVAAKIYMSGYVCKAGSPLKTLINEYAYFHQNVTIQYQQAALVASKPFLVLLVVLDAFAFLMLALLLYKLPIADIRLFNLATLMELSRRELSPHIGFDGLNDIALTRAQVRGEDEFL